MKLALSSEFAQYSNFRLRGDTSERPFGCPYCQNAFPRADVREKHMKRYHAPELDPGASGPLEPSVKRLKSTLQERSKLACDQCRKRKLKCSDRRPCESCGVKQLSCTVSSSSKPPGRPRHDEARFFVGGSRRQSTNDFSEAPQVPVDWPPQGVESTTNRGISNSSAAASTMLEQESLASSVSDVNGLARTQQQLYQQRNSPNEINLDATEAIFPFESSLLFDGAARVNQSWQDMGFMNTFWENPSLVSLILMTIYSLLNAWQGWENWLDEAGDLPSLDDAELNTTPSIIRENVSHTDSAFNMMVDHFKQRSRASSPSRGEAKRSWYSAPPRFQMYSRDVINVLLNLARSHISPTFAIFSNFEATSDTSNELCLAMAAVGALFSTAEGNIAVAKALYNDARRIHLEQTLRIEPHSFRSKLDCAKTFILLEIYGICSGDKRSYEFWEAFHYGTLQASKSCWDEAPSDPDLLYSKQLALLSEATTVLESYRVLILLRPPPFLSLQESGFLTTEKPSDNQHSVTMDLLSLLTPVAKLHSSCGNLQSLATLTSYAWMSSPRGQELSRKPQLWKPEFVELALERWMSAKAELPSNAEVSDLAQTLLYHLAHINLHANLGMLQNFAHKFCHSSRDNDTGVLNSLQVFVNGAEFEIALWHAKTMLQVVKEAMATPLSRHQQFKCRPDLMEPPHLPYCIYFATLILWYGESDARRSNSARDERIENGTQLLFKLKVHVSKVLGGALCELLSEEGRDEM